MSPDFRLWKHKQHVKPAFSTQCYISQKIHARSQDLKPAVFLSCVNWCQKAGRCMEEGRANETGEKTPFFYSGRWTVQHFPYMCLIFPNYWRLNIKLLNSGKEPNRDYCMTGNSTNYTVSYTTTANSNHSWFFPSPNYVQSNHKTHVKILSIKVPSWEKFRNSCTQNHCSASSLQSSYKFRRRKSVHFDITFGLLVLVIS